MREREGETGAASPSVLVVGGTSELESIGRTLRSHLGSESVVSVDSVSRARAELSDGNHIDRIVCDLSSSEIEALREAGTSRPVVALTRAISSEAAIEAGASDVIDPETPESVVISRVLNTGGNGSLQRDQAESGCDGREQRYHTLLEASNAAVLVFDIDGTITFASSPVERELGYEAQVLERMSASQLIHPADRSRWAETLVRLADGENGTTEQIQIRLQRADGVWLRRTLAVTDRRSDPETDGFVGVIETADGTTRNDRLATATNTLETPLLVVDSTWDLVAANDAAGQLFDHPSEERRGTRLWDLLPDDIVSEFYSRLLELRAGSDEAQTGSAESNAVTGDINGERITSVQFEVSSNSLERRYAVDARLVTSDPTAGREANDIVVFARPLAPVADRIEAVPDIELYAATLDALEDGICVLEETTIAFVNESLLEWTGADTLSGRELEALLDEEFADTVLERIDSGPVATGDRLVGELDIDAEADESEVTSEANQPEYGTKRDEKGSKRRQSSVSVSIHPISESRTCCVFQNRERSSALRLETLGQVVSDVLAVTTFEELHHVAIESLLESTEATVAGWYRPAGRRYVPTTVASTEETLEPSLPAVPRTAIEVEHENGESLLQEEEFEEHVRKRLGLGAERVAVHAAGDDEFVLATTIGTERFDRESRSILQTIAVVSGYVSAAISLKHGRKNADRERIAHRKRANRLETLFDCIQVAGRELARAETRDELEAQICEALVFLEPIDLAWVSRLSADLTAIRPTSWRGEPSEYVQRGTGSVEADELSPSERAARDRERIVTTEIARAPDDADWKRAAHEYGVRSICSVPLAFGDIRYGCLTICSTARSSFDGYTLDAASALGAMGATSIRGVETRNSLYADRVTELEAHVEDEDDPLISLATALDQRIDIETVGRRPPGGAVVYLTIADASGLDAETIGTEVPNVDAVSPVGQPGRFELRTLEETIGNRLLDHGAVLRTLSPAKRGVRLTIETPSDRKARRVFDVLVNELSTVELVSRRSEVPATSRTRRFEDELTDQMTEKQWQTLRTAFASGYFDTPRRNTGAEVADALGISQPTFNRQFRTAQQKLFELLFEDQ